MWENQNWYFYWFCWAIVWSVLELAHHWWSISLVRGIDRLYETANGFRQVDIVDTPCLVEFQSYWNSSTAAHRASMSEWSVSTGHTIDQHVSKSAHACTDFAASVDPKDCVPTSLLLRTYNTAKIVYTSFLLRQWGFKWIAKRHVHLHWYKEPGVGRKLLVIFPQFSGEFNLLSIFANLRSHFDILFVCPLGLQYSWFQTSARHSDTLEEYLFVLEQYSQIFPVTWSAGNIPFQVLDRYLELKNERHKITTLIRLDPLGYPSSNFLVYTGVPMRWGELHAKFLALAANGRSGWLGFWNHVGCLGLSYLLKTSHGYAYLKCARMLRATKLKPAPYHEHHFTATFDPMWTPGNAIFDHDRKLLCQGHVTEYTFEGFHGLWLNRDIIVAKVFPILLQY